MIHILVIFLKILLALVLLILAFLCVILFVPIRYRIDGKKEGEMKTLSDLTEQVSANVRVTWLMHLISVRFSIKEKQTHFSIKVLGYSLLGRKKQRSKKRYPTENENQEAEELVVLDDVPVPKEVAKQDEMPATEEVTEQDELSGPERIIEKETIEKTKEKKEVQQEAASEEKKKRISDRFKRIKESFTAPFRKLQSIQKKVTYFRKKLETYQRLWYDECTQSAYNCIKKQVWNLLCHYRPDTVKGWMIFGLSDPADTGQILGILSILQAFCGNRFLVEADFDQPRLEGEIFVKGHIRLCYLAGAAIVLFFNKQVRITIKRFRRILA